MIENYIKSSAYAADWLMLVNRLEELEKDYSVLDGLQMKYYGFSLQKKIEECMSILGDEREWLKVRKEKIVNSAKKDMVQNIYKGKDE